MREMKLRMMSQGSTTAEPLVDCLVTAWSPWSECSATCGGGTHYRERTKKQEAEHGGQNCTGDAREEAACNTHNCAGTHKQVFISI